MIRRRISYYKPQEAVFTSLISPKALTGAFTLKLPPLPRAYEEKVLCEIGDCIRIELVLRSFGEENARFLNNDNGFYFNKEKEWFLLTTFTMQRAYREDKEQFTLALPLSMPRVTEMTLYLYFDGVFLRYLGDGEILNENAGQDLFPFTDRLFCEGVLEAAEGALPVFVRYEEEEGNGDFYSPLPYNAYVGDVMNFYHDGVYHLLYLLDRRHHGSRNGAGAHYICHLTTCDFTHWNEEEPVVTLDVPYESHGTGTMLYHKGKYYMSYGLHTERYAEGERLGIPPYEDGGCTIHAHEEAELCKDGKYPAGATYAVSEDGIRFTKSRKLFHVGRNPSVYTNEKGGISLYVGYDGKGTWESEGFGKVFRRVKEHFPPVGTLPMRQTGECPSFFSMKGYRYLIMGFTGYFRTLTPDDTHYTDVSALGEEVYDGLCVPMVASVGDRRLIAGWPDGIGWGSVAVHRELLCLDGGRLGMKWVPELIPETRAENLVRDIYAHALPLTKGESYLFTAHIDPKEAKKIALHFTDETGEGCEILFLPKEGRMQAAPVQKNGFADPIPTMCEQFKEADPAIDYYGNTGLKQIPRYSVDFSLGGLSMLEKPFDIRILIRQSKKLGATVLDLEVGGERTLITVRRYLFPTALTLKSDKNASFERLLLTRLSHPVR